MTLKSYKKKGKINVVVDALSIKDEDVEALLCAISIMQLEWINEAWEEYKNDEEVWKLIQKFQQDPSTYDTFSWKNDSLWYKDHLCLCNNSQLKKKILLELHTSPLGGHSIFLKTYHRVKKDAFSWTPKVTKAFEHLKEAMCLAPVLATL